MSSVVTFEDLAKMKKEILGQSAPASIVKEVHASTKFRRMFNADMSLGRALTGPQFIDTVSIEDGAVTAEKLVATLVLSTTIIAGAESPLPRVTLDATGIKAYGTVSGVQDTQYYSLNSTGWSVGSGANQMTFTNATGVLAVPAAVITSLTIDDVGSGQIGGAYTSSATDTGTRLRLSTTGLEMYNGAIKTVFLEAALGKFTLSNDPVGANRLSIMDTGIELWKASVQQFKLSTGTNAVEMILAGPSAGQYVGLNPTEGIWLGAATFATASKFKVSAAGDLTATTASISGAITATSGELQTLSVTGALTISSAGVFRSGPTSGARTEMDSTGFYSYGSATAVRARLLATGAGAVGISTAYPSGVINWDAAGALTLAGFTATNTTFSSGTGGSAVAISSGATAISAGGGAFTVSNAGAISAGSGTFTVSAGGAVAASGIVITGASTFSGTVSLPNGGSISTTTVDINGNSATPGTFSNMNLDGTTSIVTGGKITNATGDTWDENGITLVSAGIYGDAIKWKQGASDTGSVYATTSAMVIRGDPTSGASVELFPSEAILRYNGTNESLQLQSTNRRALFSGYIYPGTGSAAQATRHISDLNSRITLTGQSELAGHTVGGSAANWSTFTTLNIPDKSAGYVLVYVNGVACRIPFYANG